MPVEPFEDELGAALHTTADAFEPERRDLIDGGIRRGRRRVVRRRALAVTGSVAALALVGLGGGYLTGGPGSGVEQSSVADGVPDRAKPTASPSMPPKPTASPSMPPKPGGAAFDGEKILAALEARLPEGEISKAEGYDHGAASLVFDDGEGAAAIGIGLSRVDPKGQMAREMTTCPPKALVPYDDCTSDELADGSRLMVFQGHVYPDRREDTKNWRAVLVTSEGYQVDLSEYNAPAEKGAEVTRPNPPLSPAQLREVVTVAEWRTLLEQQAVEDEVTPTPGPDATAADVSKTFAALLPKGNIVPDSGFGQEEYGAYVVDDGKGKSFVQINVQPGFLNEMYPLSQAKKELYGSPDELPDGTLVQETQGPGEKGGEGVVMWTVDALRPDGLRVVVSAFNSGAQHTAATRKTPALTMEQLRDIALSGKWDAFA